MDEKEIVDTWFKTVTGQGIGLAFTATFLLLFLVGMGLLLRLAWVWLPVLLKSTIRTQTALVENNNLLVELAERDRRDVNTLIKVSTHIVDGLHTAITKHGEKLGVGSDVLRHLEEAKKAFKDRELEVARQRELRDLRRREHHRSETPKNGTE